MKIYILLLLIGTLSANAFVAVIKKSTSGICHDATSTYYERTKNFTEFGSIEACIDSGGRLPKGYSGPQYDSKKSVAAATQESMRQGLDFIPTYERDSYNHWIDVDRDCQNARHELLILKSASSVTFTNQRRCTVKTGQWYDPFSNKTWTRASDVDIDHVVPLAYAHYRGAHAWSAKKKEQFANDPINLLIVEDNLNSQKSAKGPAEWMPPHQAYRCKYLAHFDTVMKRYQLAYRAKEKRVIDRMKQACN